MTSEGICQDGRKRLPNETEIGEWNPQVVDLVLSRNQAGSDVALRRNLSDHMEGLGKSRVG
jgi:hypothetical protein